MEHEPGTTPSRALAPRCRNCPSSGGTRELTRAGLATSERFYRELFVANGLGEHLCNLPELKQRGNAFAQRASAFLATTGRNRAGPRLAGVNRT